MAMQTKEVLLMVTPKWVSSTLVWNFYPKNTQSKIELEDIAIPEPIKFVQFIANLNRIIKWFMNKTFYK